MKNFKFYPTQREAWEALGGAFVIKVGIFMAFFFELNLGLVYSFDLYIFWFSWLVGAVGLVVVENIFARKKFNSWVKRIVYFICWYGIINTVTVLVVLMSLDTLW